MRKLQLAGALLGTMALATVAFAGPRGGGPMERITEMAAEIGLDDAQVSEIQTLMEDSRDDGKAIREQLREAKGEMKDLMGAQSPDRAAIMGQIDEISDLKAELKKVRVGTMLDIRGILTPEQFEQLQELRKERRAERQHDGPRKRGPRGGF